MRITKKTLIKTVDEITDFLMQSNQDLLQAELEENYEQCDFIQTAIYLFISNKATLLAEAGKTTYKVIFDRLKDQSDYIFKTLKERSEQA